MVRYKNNREARRIGGNCLQKLKIAFSLLNMYLLYIYVNSDVSDTFTVNWFE